MSIPIRLAVATIAALSPILASGCGTPSAPPPQAIFVAKTDGDVPSRFNRIHELEERLKKRNTVDLFEFREDLKAYSDAVTATAESILTDPEAIEPQKMQALDYVFKALRQRSEADPGSAKEKLAAMVDLIETRSRGTMLASLASYHHVQGLNSADARIFTGPEDRNKTLDAAIQKLAAAEPPHPETPKLLEELAVNAEKIKDLKRARIINTLLADRFPDDPRGARAKRALARFDLVGKVVPDFGGLDPEGKPLDLKDFRGKAVLVFFWADDMETKATDIGLMIGGMRPYSPSEVVCIGVNMDGGPDKARSFARKTSLDWPQIVSPLESDSFSDKPVPQLASRFGISAAPYELLFDQEGRLIACGVGFKSVQPALNALIPPKSAASAKTAAAN